MRCSIALGIALAALACATTPSSRAPRATSATTREIAARDALKGFVSALEAQRWPEAYALLSARWRARYTPERLATDYGAAGPISAQAVQRAHALIAAPLRFSGDTATLQVGEGKAVTILFESGEWRVDALE